MNRELKNEIAWAGFEMKTPDGWEMSRHSRSMISGTLALVDRRRERLELTWQDCESRPDLQRSCDDLRDRFRRDGYRSDELPRLKSVPGWIGFRRRLDEVTVFAHALRWNPDSGRIFQMNIVVRDDEPFPGGNMVEEILAACEDKAVEGNVIRWKAFGVDCVSPAGWELIDTRIYPMDVKLHFSDNGQYDDRVASEAIIRRLGMADTWFGGDARAYIVSRERGHDFRFKETDYGGHRAVEAVADSDKRLYYRLTGRRRIRRELIWLCEPMNSVFRVTTLCTPRHTFEPQRLLCACRHDRIPEYG